MKKFFFYSKIFIIFVESLLYFLRGIENMTQEEKRRICFMLRYETGCGMMEATIAIEKLIEALKHKPLPVMDNPPRLKITWE